MDAFRRLALAAAVVVGAIALGQCEAAAHDQHGNRNWIANGGYVSQIDGSHCCGINDCAELEPDDVQEAAGGYRLVKLLETVPFREVQTSVDGRFWRCRKPDGSRRCFFAPLPVM